MRITDEATGRGVPRIELKLPNEVKYYTDSAGIAATHEPGLVYWLSHVVPLPARSQSRSVESFMTRAGYLSAIPSTATTFDWLGQHLDWIWVRGGKSTSSQVFPLKFSDHHACWTRIEL